ncbi:MAG: hypothetical protein Q9168_008388, partial [Polycauliona sp. 1 TL-2023]
MDPHRRLQAILEGKYLSLHPDIPNTERPFIIPIHDPQGTNFNSRYSKETAESMYPASSLYEPSETSTITDITLQKQALQLHKPAHSVPMRNSCYRSEHVILDHQPTNPPPYKSPPQWPDRDDSLRAPRLPTSRRFSVTPNFIYSIPDHTNHLNLTSRQMIREQPGRISPMHVVQLPGRSTPKASQTTMAWLQVFAGFFLIMDC